MRSGVHEERRLVWVCGCAGIAWGGDPGKLSYHMLLFLFFRSCAERSMWRRFVEIEIMVSAERSDTRVC